MRKHPNSFAAAAIRRLGAGEGSPDENLSLTNGKKYGILFPNSKRNRCNDREKILSGRFREPPVAARRRGGEGCHWPSSSFAETAARFRRRRVSSPLPRRRDSSGAPDRCRKRAYGMSIRVVPRKLSFRLFSRRRRGLFCCVKANRISQIDVKEREPIWE